LPFLRDADLADWIVCAGGEDAATAPLLLLDRRDPGISLRPLRVIGRDRVFDVTLRGVSVPARHVLRAPGIAARALDRAALAGCACMVGACEHILEMTVRHATDRRQFGQPIGANQAIQHLCADMAVDVTNARHLTRAAAWADAGGNAAEAIAMARLWTMAACERVCLGAHKVHGAIGLTDEHALSIHARRLLGLRQEFGEADAWADRLATGLGL
jgi:alkylation response protein AidB-like acyl-CoA dehydrogenase